MKNCNTGAGRLSSVSRTTLLAGLAAACTLVSGCSLPHWADMTPKAVRHASQATISKTPAAGAIQPPAASAAATATQAAKVTTGKPVARGDLKAGSLTRVLDAGQSKLVITYWTAQNPTTWTAAESVPVQFSAHLEGADGMHAVQVSRFLATLDDGTTVSTISVDKGSFVITPPFSYSGAFVVHPTNRAANSATVSIEFDLLVETAPKAGQFFRQTVLDSVHLSFVKEGNTQ
jgi:hypothetical protein